MLFRCKKVELFIYFKKVEGDVWPGDDTEDRGEREDSNSYGCMVIE